MPEGVDQGLMGHFRQGRGRGAVPGGHGEECQGAQKGVPRGARIAGTGTTSGDESLVSSGNVYLSHTVQEGVPLPPRLLQRVGYLCKVLGQDLAVRLAAAAQPAPQPICVWPEGRLGLDLQYSPAANRHRLWS